MKRVVAPEGKLIDVRTTQGGLARTPRLCRIDENDDIVLTLTLSGDGAGWFGTPDQSAKLDPNGGLLRIRDESRPYAVAWTGPDNHALHVDLPRTAFDRRTRDRILGAAGGLVSPQGLSPMLAAQMRAVLDLAGTVLRLEFGSEPAEGEVCEDGMLIAAQMLIRRHFPSPALSPDEIAHRLGCSHAHLYRVFARHGLTVAGYLREARLERCRAALAVARSDETIGDIAFRCGFDNPTYFAHLFRLRFGMRPSEARAVATAAAQMRRRLI